MHCVLKVFEHSWSIAIVSWHDLKWYRVILSMPFHGNACKKIFFSSQWDIYLVHTYLFNVIHDLKKILITSVSKIFFLPYYSFFLYAQFQFIAVLYIQYIITINFTLYYIWSHQILILRSLWMWTNFQYCYQNPA